MAVAAGRMARAEAAEQSADADFGMLTAAGIAFTLGVTSLLMGLPPAIALLSLLGVLR